jgi:hypothetical protein
MLSAKDGFQKFLRFPLLIIVATDDSDKAVGKRAMAQACFVPNIQQVD